MTLDQLPSYELGRIGGVPVRVDITFLAVPLTLLPIGRMFTALGGENAQEWATRILLIWLIQIMGTFASILLHEIGHAMASRSRGVRAGSIVVGGFYGFAMIPVTAATRRAAIPILLAGPLANIAIALTLWLALGAPAIDQRLQLRIEPLGILPAWQFALRWLFYLNVALALFNLLPAFPLDGGRIARIVLRRWLGEPRAVRIIAGLGVVVGAWSCLGAAGYGLTLIAVGLFLIATNYAIWQRELAPPLD